ncbi:MAG: hypothetical protein ACLGH3_03305 [Actinomycetota bacterium]
MMKRLIATLTLASAALAPMSVTAPARADGPTWLITGYQYSWYVLFEGAGHSNYVSNPAQPLGISSVAPGGPIGNGASMSSGDAEEQLVQNLDQFRHTFTHCTAGCDTLTPSAVDPTFDVALAANDTQRVELLPGKEWTPGTYTFFCREHPWMRGSFRVR